MLTSQTQVSIPSPIVISTTLGSSPQIDTLCDASPSVILTSLTTVSVPFGFMPPLLCCIYCASLFLCQSTVLTAVFLALPFLVVTHLRWALFYRRRELLIYSRTQQASRLALLY